MKTLSLARAAAVAALLLLGAGCAAAPHAAAGAGRSAAPASGTAPATTSAPEPSATTGHATTAPPTTAPVTTGPATAPVTRGAGGIYDRVFTNPDVTIAGGRLYLSWWQSPPRQTPPRMVLARADPATGRVVDENQFSAGYISDPLYATGALWVTDTAPVGELLIRLDPRTLMVTGELRIGGPHPDGAANGHLAFAGGSIWVDGTGQLVQVSPASVSVKRTIALAGAVTSDVDASSDGGTLIVSAANDIGAGAVQRRDPATGALLASHPMAGVFAPIIGGVSGADTWIAEPSGMMGYVERFETSGMTPDRATQVEGTNGIRAQILNGVLWVTNPMGGSARNYCANPGTGHRLATLPFPDMNKDTLLAVGGDDLYYSHSADDGGSGIAAVPIPAACLNGR